jgi:hypothetical protein
MSTMNEEFITHMTKDDLLARIRQDRAAFAALWHGLSEAQMTARPAIQATWSVKDLIAHITYWESYMIERVSRLLAGGADKRLRSDEEVDEINANVYAAHKDEALSAVLTAFDASLPRVEALIAPLTDEQINDASLYTGMEIPPLYVIIGNTFGHYRDHVDDLRAYADRLR